MRRVRVLGLIVVAIATLIPATAQASVVQCFAPGGGCTTIGEFSWTRDDLFGDIFAVNNLSSGSLAGQFSSLSLTTDAGDSGFSFDPLAPASSAEAIDLLFGPTSATMTFLFGGASFSATLLSTDLVFDEFAGNSFASRLVLAEAATSTDPQVVPEPASMMLLGTGLGVLRLARRVRR